MLSYYIDNTFYLQSESHSYFLNKGPFFNCTEPEDSQTPSQNKFIITVDEGEQNLLYNSVTLDGCNFFIFVDIACNEWETNDK